MFVMAYGNGSALHPAVNSSISQCISVDFIILSLMILFCLFY